MMYRRPEEKAALRESFRKMDTPHKIEHIYTYHKWTILLVLIALYILGSTVHRQLTKKDVPLYLGLVNVSVGTELEQTMTADFLEQQGLPLKKNEVLVYKGLYLSDNATEEDHQYAYASRMKIMAAVNGKMLDVVLMNREAYDLLSQSGYLLPLDKLPEALTPYLTENEVVLESNSIDVQLNTAEEYRIVTETAANGLEVSDFPLFRDAGFDGAVYIGVIANTQHWDTAVSYLQYLLEETIQKGGLECS